MEKYTIYISQIYEFRNTIEVEAESSSQAQAMALEQFTCDWGNAVHHADQTTIAFLDAEETQALEAKSPAGTTGPGNASALDVHDELVDALQWLLEDLIDAEDDRHPETGEEYSSVAHARTVLAKVRGELVHISDEALETETLSVEEIEHD